MGKIADALERHEREKKGRRGEGIKPERPYTERPKMLIPDDPEVSFSRAFCELHGCSPKNVMLSAPDSVYAENFRILRTQILFSRNRQRPMTIMVTSSLPGEGKTFVAANLAVSLATGTDAHVLLIDSDLRRPQMHKMFGYGISDGLREYLMGRRKLEELIIRTQLKKLSILPAGRVPSNPAELFSPSTVENLVGKVRGLSEDQFVVIDSTPATVTAETGFLANYVDGIVLVVRAKKAPRDAIHETIQTLGKEKVLGLVFNGYSDSFKGYRKYYSSYYKGK